MVFVGLIIQNLFFLFLIYLLIELSPSLPVEKGEPNSLSKNGTKCFNYSQHPLVLLSMDGFSSGYLDRGLTPALQALIDQGVSAPFMETSYPSKTFPSHYSIVTGLHPESHGIIANKFFDSVFNETFSLGSATKLEGRWWEGDPMWNTVVNQGKKSAAFFWPGSDAKVNGIFPSYYKVYNSSIPFEDRVHKVLEWLQLPAEDRPIWICFYLNEPDWTGHQFGPDSPEVNKKLTEVDNIIKLLVDGIEKIGLTDCVNLMIVSDHGMSEAGPERIIPLENYLTDIETQLDVFAGAFPRISIKDDYKDKKVEIMQNLSCKRDEMRQYEPFELPKRLHFSNNPRIEDIVIDLNPGFVLSLNENSSLMGHHGYDPLFTSLQTIVIGKGPDLASGGKVVEPFQSVELYNLMCGLVKVKPSPNNGTEGLLYSMLKSPPPNPNITEKPLPAVIPSIPTNSTHISRLKILDCGKNKSSIHNSHLKDDMLLRMNLSDAEINESISRHLPWSLQYRDEKIPGGTNKSIESDIQLLVHEDHIIGYSATLKQPLWASFTINQTKTNLDANNSTTWFKDARLDGRQTINCQHFKNILEKNCTMDQLFPKRFSVSSTSLVTNIIPMTKQLSEKWLELIDILLVSWINSSSSPVNVVIGPVFDYNADSHADNLNKLGTGPHIPTEVFMVVTRCQMKSRDLNLCPLASLDSIAFIYPQSKAVQNCQDTKSFARMYSAKVRDVELITNLQFFPKLDFESRVRLVLRIHSNIWPTTILT